MLASLLKPVSAAPGTFANPALDLRFDLGEVDPRITFTRASTDTRNGPLGTLESVAANAPVIEYAPTTLHTSATALTVGLGTKTLALGAGPGFAPGTPVRLTRNGDPTTWMSGITLWTRSGSLRVAVLRFNGAGSHSNWSIVECLGLRIQEARTNLLTYSEQFDNAAWGKTRCSVSANAALAPDGNVAMDKLIEDSTASATHLIALQSVVLTLGSSYTFSVFAAPGERVLQVVPNGGNFPITYVNFDLSSGVVSAQGSDIGATIVPVGGGRYRCTVTVTCTAGGTVVPLYVYMQSSPTAARAAGYTGDGVSGFYVWGAQLEAGSFLTSYTPTTSAAVTRAADVAAMTGTNFSDWYRQDEGTLVAAYRKISVSQGVQVVASLDDGTVSNIMRFVCASTPTQQRFDITSAGVGMATLALTTSAAAGVWYVDAAAYKLNDVAAVENGGVVQIDNTVTIPVVNRLNIGRGTNGSPVNGHVRRIAYYPKRLSNPNLQARSA